MSCVIVAGGEVDHKLLADVLAGADTVIAADRGLEALQQAKVCPDYIIGDFDSASEATRARLAEYEKQPSAQVIRLQPEKDDTDTELALKVAMEQAGPGGKVRHARGKGDLVSLGDGLGSGYRRRPEYIVAAAVSGSAFGPGTFVADGILRHPRKGVVLRHQPDYRLPAAERRDESRGDARHAAFEGESLRLQMRSQGLGTLIFLVPDLRESMDLLLQGIKVLEMAVQPFLAQLFQPFLFLVGLPSRHHRNHGEDEKSDTER